jgi:hypothetical protein
MILILMLNIIINRNELHNKNISRLRHEYQRVILIYNLYLKYKRCVLSGVPVLYTNKLRFRLAYLQLISRTYFTSRFNLEVSELEMIKYR